MAVSSTPSLPTSAVTNISAASIKPATPDLIDFDESLVPIDFMSSIFFENVGAQELINISRTDLVNGLYLTYSPIKNITNIAQKYSPQNIFTVPVNAQSIFNNYALKLEDYVPETGTGPNSEMIYTDPVTRDIVVNVINMINNERVEIEVLNHGEALGDILY